jgi:glycine cleavage system aminomethyltransferase T
MGAARPAGYISPTFQGSDVLTVEKKNIKYQTGPASADHLQALTSYDLRALTFGRSAFVPLEGINVHIARGGYTGEDGFEVSLQPLALFWAFPPHHAAQIQHMGPELTLQSPPLTSD